MDISTAPDAIWVQTQVFPHWSVTVPRSLTVIDPDSAEDEGYWHARDEHRSVSMTSYLLVDAATLEPVPATQIFDKLAAQVLPDGRSVTDQPDGLLARAVIADDIGSSVASQALQGVVAADGVALITTITSDDEAWCRRVWNSIRHLPDEPLAGAPSA